MPPCSDLEHLLDLPARQINVQLVEELVDLVDVQKTISILISLFKRLLHPRHTALLRNIWSVAERLKELNLSRFVQVLFMTRACM